MSTLDVSRIYDKLKDPLLDARIASSVMYNDPTPEYIDLNRSKANSYMFGIFMRTSDLHGMIERFAEGASPNAHRGILLNPNVTEDLVRQYIDPGVKMSVNAMMLSWSFIAELDQDICFWDLGPEVTLARIAGLNDNRFEAAILSPVNRLLDIAMYPLNWATNDLTADESVANNPNVTLEFMVINLGLVSEEELRRLLSVVPPDLWPEYGIYFGGSWLDTRCRHTNL